MKIRILLVFALVSIIVSSAVAQVQIVPNKVTYKRTGKNVPNHKKTFEVTYPIVKSSGNDAAQRSLKTTVDYWSNFGTTLKENLGDYYWLDSFDYKVNYNKNNLLDIELNMIGSGAYSDWSVKTLVVDTKTGRRLYINDVFTRIGQLVLKIDKAQQAEIRQAKKDAKAEGRDDADSIDELIGITQFTANKLEEFSISDKGITFLYDYGFPHLALTLEPEGKYFFTWAQMKPHIKKNGALAGLSGV